MPFIAKLSFIRDTIARAARPGPEITLIFPLGPQLFWTLFFFACGMHREFTTGKLAPRPSWPELHQVYANCTLSFSMNFPSPTTKLAGARLWSWFPTKFPSFDAEIVSKCKEIQRPRGKSLKRANVRGDKEISGAGAVVYVVFSQNLWRNSEFLWVCPIEDIWPTEKSLSYPHDQRLRKSQNISRLLRG